MRPNIIILAMSGLLALSACQRNIQTTRQYYDNGILKYDSKTITYGADSEFEKYNKTVTYIKEYYENGNLELEQKVVERPAFHKQDKVSGEPVNTMPKKKRKYRKYNRAGELVEKGVEKTGKSTVIQYNIGIYKKIKTKSNQDWREDKVKYWEKY